jgi:hypothetical protein
MDKGRQEKNKKDGNEVTDLDLFVSDEEWDMWLLDRKKWNILLPVFASQTEMKKRKNQ